MKRTLSLLLVLLLCLTFLPLRAARADTAISSVAITIDVPAAGDLPDYLPSLPGAGGRYDLRVMNNDVWRNGVKWFDYTDGTLNSPLTPGIDRFEGDRIYRVAINLEPGSGYTFTSSTTATVDGSTATAELGVDGILAVKYVFPRTSNAIASADVTVTEPREDYQPSFEAQTSGVLYTVDNVKWYELYQEEYMDNHDRFYGHGEFRAEIRLAPKSGYVFSGAVTGKINGRNASATLQDDGKLLLTYTFTCPYPIRDPQVYIDQPIPGKAPDYTPRFYSKAYGQSSNGFGQYRNGVAWQDVTTGYYMEIGTDVFEGGHDYRVYIYVKPSSTYIFPSNVKGRINDKDADTVLGNDGEVLLKYVFHCDLPVPPVSVTVKAPAVGAHPDYDPVFPADAHCYASYSEGCYKNGVLWVDLTRKADDGYGFMYPDSSVFEAGHQYKVYIHIWAKTGYVITDGFSCTINGTAATYESNGEYTRTFPTLAAAKPTITTQPKGVTVNEGKAATFKVVATGATGYKWQYQKPGESTWTNVKTNGTSASYSLTTAARHNGYKYRCKVSNAAGSVTSSAVTLMVKTKPVITTQPKGVTVNEGKTATFKVVATGATSYKWQYQKPGSSTWTDVSNNGTSATYSLTTAARHNGYKYRCKVTNSNGTVTSSTATLTIGAKPTITTQPKGVTVNEGKAATFKVVATGATGYKWQYQKPGTSTWTDVSNNGTSATYSLTTAARHNGYKYRCKVTNAAGSVYSSAVTLTVKTKPVITTQPKAKTVTAGAKATFKVVAEGATGYKWQYQKPGSSTWTDVSKNGTSATYTLTTAARHNGYKYRCKVTNSAGSIYSNAVTLTVKSK